MHDSPAAATPWCSSSAAAEGRISAASQWRGYFRRPPEAPQRGENDTAIAIKSRSDPYGPAAIELFDVETGELKESVMTYGIAAGRPHWARGFEDWGNSVD